MITTTSVIVAYSVPQQSPVTWPAAGAPERIQFLGDVTVQFGSQPSQSTTSPSWILSSEQGDQVDRDVDWVGNRHLSRVHSS